jgi:hypothetical protein
MDLQAQPTTIINDPNRKAATVVTEKGVKTPVTESLKDCAMRVKTVWMNGIAPRIARGETVLVVAHANSIRSLIKCIDAATMDEVNVRGVHIPSATPLVYAFTNIDPAKYTFAGATPIKEVGKTILPIGVPSKLGMTGRYLATKEVMQMNLGVIPVDEDQQFPEGSSMFDLIDKDLNEVIEYADRGGGRHHCIMVSDGRGKVLYANANWQKTTGFTNDDIRGRTCKFLQGPLTSTDAVDALNEKLRTGLPAKAVLLNVSVASTETVIEFLFLAFFSCFQLFLCLFVI